jgi:flagellar basal-body rod modification protein FlgD
MNISPFTIGSLMQNTAPQAAAASSSSSSSSGSPSGTSQSAGLANEETFLQLLVAQIKNQDPTQPTDGTQFLTQLAQFSQLEQLIGIKQDLDSTQQPTSGTGQPVNAPSN